MKVSAVVVSHGNAADLERSLPALAPQVDELLVIQNLPEDEPANARVLRNDRPLGFAANVNRGVRETTGELVLTVNPDAVAHPGAVDALRAFMEAHPKAGVAGPKMLYPNGEPQPSRRSFPTVAGTLVRRTPLRRLRDPYVHQARHYNLGDVPAEREPGLACQLRHRRPRSR